MTETRVDAMDPSRTAALLAALGRDTAAVGAGAALPPFFHHLYFWEARPPEALGRDGHPRPGGLIPQTGLPRRMWAGGRLSFLRPVRLGQAAQKVSKRASVVEKAGRSGPLAFVTLSHEIWQDGALCVTEAQDLVYREDPAPGAPAPAAPQAPDPVASSAVDFDTTLLFRYSALTFNGHRIHYDLDYARGVEGYPGLVVHGPLLAQLLMLRAEAALGGLTRFSFRVTAPVFHTERAVLCQDGAALWVAGPGGRLCLTAEAG